MKKKFKLEDYEGKKYAMHCPEKWQAEAYKKFIDKHNLRCDEQHLIHTRKHLFLILMYFLYPEYF